MSTRVLHLVRRLGVGGVECLIEALCRETQPDDPYQAEVCAWHSGGAIADRMLAQGAKVRVLGLRRRSLWMAPLALADVVGLVWRLRCIVRRERIRLLHAHLSDSAFLALLVARLSGCKAVTTEHSVRMLPFGIAEGSPMYRLRMAIQRFTLSRLHAVFCVSDTVRDVVIKEGRAAPRKTATIRNGVPRPQAVDRAAVRAELGLADSAIALIVIGRLVVNKRVDVLLDMLALLADDRVQLLVVGDGEEAESLAKKCQDLQLSSQVQLLGRRNDVARLIAAADIGISASLFEGISLAVLESMVAGLPMLSAPSPGNIEVLAHGAGVISEDGSAEALVAALKPLLEDRTLRMQYAAAGQRRIASTYSLDVTRQVLHACYDRVLGNNASKRAARRCG